jgi:hypothetical protein
MYSGIDRRGAVTGEVCLGGGLVAKVSQDALANLGKP